jgi:hypothetical protein
MGDFPVWVVHDCRGRDFYAEAVRPWRRDDLLPADLRLPADRAVRDAEDEGALGGG